MLMVQIYGTMFNGVKMTFCLFLVTKFGLLNTCV